MKNCTRIVTCWCLVVPMCLVADAAQDVKQIDVQKSSLTVRVYKSGLFSAFAHDHEITAPIARGTFRESSESVELTVDARSLRVVDRDVSEKDRAEIQETMLGAKVLDSQRFPEIRYRSRTVERLGTDKWLVQGDLTLHGQTHPVRIEVEGLNGHYRGSATVSQKDFGIAPVRVAGGAVKVKNEVRIEFEVIGQ
jgi:polyisoprenoid-binding protein YceI